MNQSLRFNSPPKVRLTFRIGVVGHRPNRLKREDISSLTKRLGEVLSSVKKSVLDFSTKHPGLFNNESPCLRAVSPLAEGTDRYFAREALKLNYELCSPMPFQREEFENDFKPPHSLEPEINSVTDFNDILAAARVKGDVRIFELDGARDKAGEAYAAAGRVVLNQSDLLVVVWDGGGEEKHGGTYETLVRAVRFAIPVVWIDAHAPHQWQLVQKEPDLPKLGPERCVPPPAGDLHRSLAGVIGHVLNPPESTATTDRHHVDLRTAYFAETMPKWNRFFGWKFFRGFVDGGSLCLPPLRVTPFEEAVIKDWPEKGKNEVEDWVNHRLRSHYAWSDKLADLYADKYRSSFIFGYLAAAFAVLFGVLGYFNQATKWWPAAEVIIVSWILTRIWWGNRCHWHQRWIEYRVIAELVRQLRFLIPLGGGRPFPRLAQHLSFGNPANTWMYWHIRAIDRALGLPTAEVTSKYLLECRDYIAGIIDGQVNFHLRSAERSARIEHRLHIAGAILFGLTFLLAFGHLLSPAGGLLHEWHVALIPAAIFPAFAAAMAAISNQAEFARIARRSAAMAGRLEQEVTKLANYDDSVHSNQVTEDALRVAQTMVDEVLDWRLVFLDRPLVTPA
jgi:hypothetical protein